MVLSLLPYHPYHHPSVSDFLTLVILTFFLSIPVHPIYRFTYIITLFSETPIHKPNSHIPYLKAGVLDSDRHSMVGARSPERDHVTTRFQDSIYLDQFRVEGDIASIPLF